MKIINVVKVLFSTLLLLLFVACNNNPCDKDGRIMTISILMKNSPVPQKGYLYIYAKDNKFEKPEIKLPMLKPVNVYDQFAGIEFDHEFLKEKNYRVVLDDSIVFDIGEMTHGVYIDSSSWTMTGPMKKCVIVAAQVNGVYLDKEFLNRTYMYFPYSMHKIVHFSDTLNRCEIHD